MDKKLKIEIQGEDVLIVGHHGCGMSNLNSKDMIKKMESRGISEETILTIKHCGIDVEKWLHGFGCVEESVKKSVTSLKNHPLMPSDVNVHGLVIDPQTGELNVIVNGYE